MQATINSNNHISVRRLMSRFRWRILFTMALVLIESGLSLAFPLFIGASINGLLEQRTTELFYLGGLGILMLIVGSARRFFDTRAYSNIYTTISTETVEREQKQGKPLTVTTARVQLLTEFVEFLENSFPMIIESLIGIVGVLLIILSLNVSVFLACLALFGLMVVIYILSGKLNFRLNKNFNDELEKRVDVLSTQQRPMIENHFKAVMKWNIHLSDLETVNYAVIWLGIIMVLVYSPIAVIDSGVINFGLIFSTLMYVFQYIENIVMLPLFIQQIIRLQEISVRLSD